MFDLVREISQTIRNNKLRTFLTGFAVAWGIFMLMVLLGMGRGIYNNFAERSSGDSVKNVSVYRGNTSKPFKGFKEGRAIEPKSSDMEALMRDNADDVESVYSYKYLSSTNFSTPRDYITKNPEGVFPQEQTQYKIEMAMGRFINDADIKYHRKSLVISMEDAITLFGDSSKAVGSVINGMGLSWQIVGVYAHDWLSDAFVPFTTAVALSNADTRNTLSNLQVRIKGVGSEEEADAVTERIRATLAKEHDFDPTDQSALWTYNRFKSYLREKQAFGILDMAIWAIGILTLLSGIVGVSNIMFVSVKERTHEIGIRRAIGAKPRSILLQVVLESVAITALFGYIGIFLGTAAMQIVNHFWGDTDFMRNPTIDISIAIEVTIALIIAGALAGLFPAIKATKVKPVEALRDE